MFSREVRLKTSLALVFFMLFGLLSPVFASSVSAAIQVIPNGPRGITVIDTVYQDGYQVTAGTNVNIPDYGTISDSVYGSGFVHMDFSWSEDVSAGDSQLFVDPTNPDGTPIAFTVSNATYGTVSQAVYTWFPGTTVTGSVYVSPEGMDTVSFEVTAPDLSVTAFHFGEPGVNYDSSAGVMTFTEDFDQIGEFSIKATVNGVEYEPANGMTIPWDESAVKTAVKEGTNLIYTFYRLDAGVLLPPVHYTYSDSVSGNAVFHWIDAAGDGTLVTDLQNLDDQDAEVALPFDFEFYGVKYNKVDININGALHWSQTDNDYSLDSEDGHLPDHTLPSSMLVYFDDLTTQVTGNVYTKTVGSPGSRQFIIQWNLMNHYDLEGTSLESSEIVFQAILYEGTNQFKYQYLDTEFGTDPNVEEDYNHGANAVVGIQDDYDKDVSQAGRFLEYSSKIAKITDGLAVNWSDGSTKDEAKDTTPPSAPQGLAALGGPGQVYLFWQPNEELDLDGYNVYMDGVKVNGELLLTNSYIVDTGLVSGRTYHFTVKAVDTSGNESEASDEAVGMPYGEFQSKTLHVNGKTAGEALKPGDGIVTFTPATNGTANKLHLHLVDVYPRQSVGDYTTLVPAHLTAGDFELVKPDGSKIGISAIDISSWTTTYAGNENELERQYPAIDFILDSALEAGQQYTLKMSGTSGGNEIYLPKNPTSDGFVYLATQNKDADAALSFDAYMFEAVTISAPTPPSTGGSSGPVTPPSTQTPTGTTGGAQVDGDSVTLGQDAGQVTKETDEEGNTVARVSMDDDTLGSAFRQLEDKDAGAQTVTIEITETDPVIRVELPAGAVAEAMETTPDAVVSIKTDDFSYNLPIKLLDVNHLAERLGTDAKDLKINVTMEKVSGQAAADLEAKANEAGIELLGSPVDFSITVEAGGKELEVNDFGTTYVTRTIMIAQELHGDEATVVLYDPVSGQMTFVPAIFTTVDGKTQVTIKRNGNSVYTVAKFKKTFADVSNHWAKTDIELLASKLVVKGLSETEFGPDASITRAQFASMLVRALGLKEDKAGAAFRDVSSGDWFAGAIGAAVKAGIVNGMEDGTFRPNESISREQMAVMIARALKAGGKTIDDGGKEEELLGGFRDNGTISTWAQTAAAQAVQAGIIQGMSGDSFAPAETATRAQAAVMLKRLLQALEFIG